MTRPSRSFDAILALFAFGFVLAGCAGGIPPAGTVAYQPVEYQLASGDQLRVTVFGNEALSKEYTVSSAGDLSFPLLGDVPVVGKSVSQVQDFLAAKLSEGYINDPRLNVEVLNYRPFYILGEVGRAGEYPFKDNLTVSQAIALAGGYSYRADKGRVFIRRVGRPGEETYDLGTDTQVYIAPGDTIRVGERYF